MKILKTCPSCGEPSGGFMKLCARCKNENIFNGKPVDPIRPIKEPEE